MSDVQNSYTHRSKKDFTLIQNNLIRSASLSCKAFKLLCVGLSHSGGWVFRKSQIAACFKEGMHTVDEGMKELRSLGYLHLRAKKKENNDFAGHEWFWFEKPVSAEEFKLFLGDGAFQGFRDSGGSEAPGDIRRPIPKKTKLKKEEVSKDNVKTMPSFVPIWKENGNYLRAKYKKVCTGSGDEPPLVHEMNHPGSGDEGKEEPIKKNHINKDNVKTMPSFSKEKNFIHALDKEQKKLHDELVRYQPNHGSKLDSKDVCAWFLSRNYTTEQVRESFDVYKQDAAEAKKRGDSVKSMGGCMVNAIKSGRKKRSIDEGFNKEYAKNLEKTHKFITVMERYVKVVIGNVREEIELKLPKSQFVSQLDSIISLARIYA